MSADVENSPHELYLMSGATITDIRVHEDPDPYGMSTVRMELTLNEPHVVNPNDCPGGVVRKMTVEVWQDEEGNGPGYLAIVGMEP